MKRLIVHFALIGIVSLILSACGEKGAKLQKSVVPPDKTLFETASGYLHKSDYIKARLAFQTLINTYPDSDLTADSYLGIGDSFYNEGGTENLLQAEDQYKNFIVFFPTNPKAADAQMKIISLNMKMMRSPDRDQQYSYKAEQAIKKMFEQFPDSDYIPIAKQQLIEVQEVLAQGDFGVGRFYADKGNFLGAKSRFQEIVDKYANFSSLDEAYFSLADAAEKTKNPDDAAIYYAKIASGYPFSRRFEDAKQRLQALGKPLPQVDTQLAALNQSRLKPAEGFSPLKPFINFAEALGFKGPPDRYEAAKRTIEAEKAQTAEAQAAKAGEGGKAADDILIESVITKNASGETKDTTVLGAASGAEQTSSDKDGAKKKESGKNKKKETGKNKKKESGKNEDTSVKQPS